MKKIVWTYGLISGGIAALLMVGMGLYLKNNMSNLEGSEVLGYSGIILSMVLVFMGVRAYRDQVAGGRISFGKGFQVGILITLISCICYALAWEVVHRTLMPDFMEQFIAASLDKMKASGASAEEISENEALMDQYRAIYQNLFTRIGITFLEPFPVGLLVTLATAGILRKS